MNYLKALLLPVFVWILLFMAIAALEMLAVQQYFSGGPGQALGELVWTTQISVYTKWPMQIAIPLWAGYRTAKIAGVRVAAISSGALVFASFILFFVLVGFIDRGVSEAVEVFRGPHTGLIKSFVLAIVAGATGAWLKEHNEAVT